MEGVVLILVTALPWAFGGVDPVYEFALAVGVSLLLLLWAAISLLNGRLTWVRCAVAPILVGLVLLAILQLVPLPLPVLRIISPGTADLASTMLPAQPEQLSESIAIAASPVLRPISVYPHATRIELLHWLEVLIVFTAVRNQVASTASMKRLAIAVLVNGCALSLFGLFQYFSSRPDFVFGIETGGKVFGPFINRNHAAAYLNMSLATGVGLLLATVTDPAEYKRRMVQKPNAPEEQDELHSFSPLAVLHSPIQLWTCVGLALIVAGVVCSLSRGGVASLTVALIVCLMLRLTWPPRIGRIDFLILPGVLLLGILAWIGVKPLETRLGTILQGSTFEDGRWAIWLDLLRLIPSYPIFGSGYGTLQYVEPMTRGQADTIHLVHFDYILDHAHNDYLEAFVEGGILRFALTVLLVGVVMATGFRALRRYLTRTPGAYAFGALFAIVAIAVHSLVDFSVTTPAVACLTTVLAAQLVSLARNDPTVTPSAAHAKVLTLKLGLGGRIAVAVMACGLAAVLVLFAWNLDRVHRLRLGAFRAIQRSKPPDYHRAIDFLLAAVRRDPTDADLRIELGQAYLDIRNNGASQEGIDRNIVLGLEQMAIARELCPALPRPQVRFAAYAPKLQKTPHARTDTAEEYWRRAMRLAPTDRSLTYYHGLQAFDAGRYDDAYASWKQSLAVRPDYLLQVIDRAATKLDAQGLIDKVLPDHPDALVRTAERIDPEFARDPGRTIDPRIVPLLRRASELLKATEPIAASDYYLRGRVAEALDDRDEALRSYRTALDMMVDPSQRNIVRWRYAKLLHRLGKLEEARREFATLDQTGNFPAAKAELELIDHELRP